MNTPRVLTFADLPEAIDVMAEAFGHDPLWVHLYRREAQRRRYLRRFFRAILSYAIGRRYAPGPHYHLESIGVRPSAQGKGHASSLIRPFIAEAEARTLAVYTETMTFANVSLYEHLGFELMERRDFGGSLRLWSLLKVPV